MWAQMTRACQLGDEASCLSARVLAPPDVCPPAWAHLGDPGWTWVAGTLSSPATDEELVRALVDDTSCSTDTVHLSTAGDVSAGRWVTAAASIIDAGDEVKAFDAFSPPGAWEIATPELATCASVESCLAPVLEQAPYMLLDPGAPLDRLTVVAQPDQPIVALDLSRRTRGRYVDVVVDGQTASLSLAPQILGVLDKSHIDAVIKRDIGAIQTCYPSGLMVEPHITDRVVVFFVIGEDGRVTESEIKETELADDAVEACILNAFSAMQFDPPNGVGIVRVSYPFLFQPTEDYELRLGPRATARPTLGPESRVARPSRRSPPAPSSRRSHRCRWRPSRTGTCPPAVRRRSAR
ncbi:MAG: AgmX/PglI C-terminal domain-containing protein [Proteobacteria bacterium]|nr:AgmX/PglI C-terminal domain-containing protein [Pseudomonadota bacterium]